MAICLFISFDRIVVTGYRLGTPFPVADQANLNGHPRYFAD